MEKKYQIIKTEKIDDKVRLSLKPEELTKKREPGFRDMVMNPKELMNDLKQDAVFSQLPDLITITYEEWKKHEYKLDDFVEVIVKPG